MFRFTIRDVLWLTVVVGLAVGWWLDHRQVVPLRKRCNRLATLAMMSVDILRDRGIDATFENDNITIGGSHWPPERAPWNQDRKDRLGHIPPR